MLGPLVCIVEKIIYTPSHRRCSRQPIEMFLSKFSHQELFKGPMQFYSRLTLHIQIVHSEAGVLTPTKLV